ncbi:hypothetical protein HN011_012150 [Eciton burchellii]|nr:hypothetical protein HN011_012150 [Eciton burchellii]
MFHIIARRMQRTATTFFRTFSAQVSSESPVRPTKNINVPGLSENIVKMPNTSVGPNASKNAAYKNPEYFCYHIDSFGEAEVELAKYRLPAPSNKKLFQK